MKKTDKLKRTRYEISMKILAIENKSIAGSLSKKEQSELVILKKKEDDLNKRIETQTK